MGGYDGLVGARLRLLEFDRVSLRKANGVQINISTRHGELAVATQEKITHKIEKLMRYHPRIAAVNVMVDLGNSANPDVEIIVSVERASDFVSRTRTSDGKLLGAVDAAVHKLEEQLKRYKEKRIDQHRVPAAHPEGPGATGVEEEGLDREVGG